MRLAHARAQWPECESAHRGRRVEGLRRAREKYGSAVAHFLADVYLPELPPSTDVVAHTLELECGHEEFWFSKRTGESNAEPTRSRCPIFCSCQLGGGRAAVRYLEAGEPEPRFSGSGLTRWSVRLSCGHPGEVWVQESVESRLGDFIRCRACGQDADDGDEIIAMGQRLPDAASPVAMSGRTSLAD